MIEWLRAVGRFRWFGKPFLLVAIGAILACALIAGLPTLGLLLSECVRRPVPSLLSALAIIALLIHLGLQARNQQERESGPLEAGLRVPEEPGASETLFEQYKLYVDVTDRNSARRDSANNWLAAANAAFLVAFAKLEITVNYRLVFAMGGILFGVVWLLMINSYQRKMKAKGKIIEELEWRMPANPWQAEYRHLKEQHHSWLTDIEKLIPGVIIIYWLLFLATWHGAG